MSTPFLGEIRMFGGSYAPTGWALCNGQLLSATDSNNAALFALLGTMYGGDGVNTFALPNLQCRIPLHAGQGPGLSAYTQGEASGTASQTLNNSQIPLHTHTLGVSTRDATTRTPAGNVPAVGPGYGSTVNSVMVPTPTSAPTPVSVLQPTLTVTFIICLSGIFPSRN